MGQFGLNRSGLNWPGLFRPDLLRPDLFTPIPLWARPGGPQVENLKGGSRRVLARRVGARTVWSPKGVERPKISRSLPLSRHNFHLCFPLLEVFSRNCERGSRPNSTQSAGSFCASPGGLQEPRQQFHEKTPKREARMKIVTGEGKKREFLGGGRGSGRGVRENGVQGRRVLVKGRRSRAHAN